MMRFGSPQAAYLFLIIPILCALFALALNRNKKAMTLFNPSSRPDDSISLFSASRQTWKFALIVGALAFSILALMRPLGSLQTQQTKQEARDIIIAVDVSKSMLCTDLPPNRLDYAKRIVRELMPQLRGDRLGVVAFAGSGFLVCPLTSDTHLVELSLDALNEQTIPRGGTSLAAAIDEGVKGFRKGREDAKALIVLTDGETHEGDTVRSAQAAAKEDVRIFTVGTATPAGELIPIARGGGSGEFLKDSAGQPVKSRLIEDPLRQVAQLTGGTYLQADASGQDLQRLYREHLATMPRRTREARETKTYQERFQTPLGIALGLLLIGPWIARRKKPS